MNEMESVQGMKEDGSMILRSEILKQYRFPEIDLVVTGQGCKSTSFA